MVFQDQTGKKIHPLRFYFFFQFLHQIRSVISVFHLPQLWSEAGIEPRILAQLYATSSPDGIYFSLMKLTYFLKTTNLMN